MKLSKHATARIQSRGIKVTAHDILEMDSAIFNASKKKIKNLLYIEKDIVAVLSVKNETMITIFYLSEGNIFTGIDGVIIK